MSKIYAFYVFIILRYCISSKSMSIILLTNFHDDIDAIFIYSCETQNPMICLDKWLRLSGIDKPINK